MSRLPAKKGLANLKINENMAKNPIRGAVFGGNHIIWWFSLYFPHALWFPLALECI
jgi:hypothetical protein